MALLLKPRGQHLSWKLAKRCSQMDFVRNKAGKKVGVFETFVKAAVLVEGLSSTETVAERRMIEGCYKFGSSEWQVHLELSGKCSEQQFAQTCMEPVFLEMNLA